MSKLLWLSPHVTALVFETKLILFNFIISLSSFSSAFTNQKPWIEPIFFYIFPSKSGNRKFITQPLLCHNSFDNHPGLTSLRPRLPIFISRLSKLNYPNLLFWLKWPLLPLSFVKANGEVVSSRLTSCVCKFKALQMRCAYKLPINFFPNAVHKEDRVLLSCICRPKYWICIIIF